MTSCSLLINSDDEHQVTERQIEERVMNTTNNSKMYCPRSSCLFKAILRVLCTSEENNLSKEFRHASIVAHVLLTWASSQGAYIPSLKFHNQERSLETFLLGQDVYPDCLQYYQDSLRNNLMSQQIQRKHERNMKYKDRRMREQEMITSDTIINHTETTMFQNIQTEGVIDSQALLLLAHAAADRQPNLPKFGPDNR